jgi:hypothetical protein
VSTVPELLALRELDADAAAAFLGVDPSSPRAVAGYGSLKGMEVLESSERGIRFFLRGPSVVLVYIGGALTNGVDDAALVAEVGSSGEPLRSRQGKRAVLHVVPSSGVAWSELDGEVGWIELFPPTTMEDYRRDIYVEPPPFAQ